MTDAVVKWEPFTVAGSQSGEIMVINATITVIPAELQMCVECIHVRWIEFSFILAGWWWVQDTWRSPRNERPQPREAVQTWHRLESRNRNLSPTEAPKHHSEFGGGGALVLHVKCDLSEHKLDQNNSKSQSQAKALHVSQLKTVFSRWRLITAAFLSWEKWHLATISKGSRKKMYGMYGMPSQAHQGEWVRQKYLH